MTTQTLPKLPRRAMAPRPARRMPTARQLVIADQTPEVHTAERAAEIHRARSVVFSFTAGILDRMGCTQLCDDMAAAAARELALTETN